MMVPAPRSAQPRTRLRENSTSVLCSTWDRRAPPRRDDAAECNETLKKTPPARPAWRRAFLARLSATANVLEASHAAKIASSTAYRLRDRDPAFHAAWDQALEDSIAALEYAARQRALTTSDTLAIFLLKVHRPEKYRDRYEVRHTGDVLTTFVPDMGGRRAGPGGGRVMVTAPPPPRTYERPALYPLQAQAVFGCLGHAPGLAACTAGAHARYCVTEASTKSGKTHGCIVWLLEQALLGGQPGRHYWWVAPIYRQAQIAYERIKHAVRSLSDVHTNDTEMRIVLPNGAALECRTGERPDALYGEDVYAAVLDEATRMRRSVWAAVRTTLTATEGPVRVIGNVKSSRNWAYRMARDAEQRRGAGDTDWQYAHITAHDAVEAGVLSAGEIADAQRTLSEGDYTELYEARAAETLAPVYAPFTEANVSADVAYVPRRRAQSPTIEPGDLLRIVRGRWSQEANGALSP